jgi:hypothetical protein
VAKRPTLKTSALLGLNPRASVSPFQPTELRAHCSVLRHLVNFATSSNDKNISSEGMGDRLVIPKGECKVRASMIGLLLAGRRNVALTKRPSTVRHHIE